MGEKIQKMKWDLHSLKWKYSLIWGFSNNSVKLYDDELIEKLRDVYYGDFPASIILLSNFLSNGHCYKRALLLASALLDTDDDIKLVYASINSIKLNPTMKDFSSDHCFVLRTTKDNKQLVYDTSNGLVYDKKIYWKIEKPKVRKVNDKDSIKKFLEENKNNEIVKGDPFIKSITLPMIENTYGNVNEVYSFKGIELLQREVELYKKKINYNKKKTFTKYKKV